MESSKLRAKVGVHEFEAEGPAEQVTAQYNAWMERIATLPSEYLPQMPIKAPRPAIPAERVTEARTHDGYTTVLDLWEVDEARDLRKLIVHPPAGETRDADAILLVIYGYRKIGNGAENKGTARVPVTKIKQSLDVSGIGVARVDRTAKPYVDARYLLKSGRGKGGVYELTVTGMTRAEEMAQKLFAERVS